MLAVNERSAHEQDQTRVLSFHDLNALPLSRGAGASLATRRGSGIQMNRFFAWFLLVVSTSHLFEFTHFAYLDRQGKWGRGGSAINY